MNESFLMPTALPAAIGALLWIALAVRSATSPMSVQRLVLMVFVVGLACRLVLLFATPTFYAPDEQSHFNYIKYLYEQRQFPVQTSQTNAPTNDWEYYQPPLYYLLEAPVYAVARVAFGDNTERIVWALRAPSIVLWGGNVLLLSAIMRRRRIENRFVIVGAASAHIETSRSASGYLRLLFVKQTSVGQRNSSEDAYDTSKDVTQSLCQWDGLT